MMLPHKLQEVIAEARKKISCEAGGPNNLFVGEGVFHAVDDRQIVQRMNDIIVAINSY